MRRCIYEPQYDALRLLTVSHYLPQKQGTPHRILRQTTQMTNHNFSSIQSYGQRLKKLAPARLWRVAYAC